MSRKKSKPLPLRNAQQPAPSASLTTLREQVEEKRLRLEESRLNQEVQLLESVTDSVFGTPIDFNSIWSYRGMPLLPVFYRDLYQSKQTTLRILQDLDRERNLARYAYETNPNAQAIINGLCAFVIGGGLTPSVSPKKAPGAAEDAEPDDAAKKEAARAQRILEEFAEVNELVDAGDGCPVYDEAFQRQHVEGEVFCRLFPDEFEPTKLRFVEPDNIRPPAGESWEGPWSYGILTAGNTDGLGNLAWDTQTPKSYNVNYPFVNRDEQVEPQFIFHLKRNCKKNQKRGVSTLYCVDEDLRGTQKLRYAAREGAKIRASIPYVRQHAMADASTVMNLQAGLITDSVKRVAGNGQEYQVPVQQIEPGTVQDINAGLEMKDPPADPNWNAVASNLQAGLETIAARINAPAWLASGASNDSSFAASLTAESPFVKRITKEQAINCGFWKRVFQAVLEIAIEQGRLLEGALERLHISVTAPSPEVRKPLDEAQTNDLLHEKGVISLREWSARADVVFDEQQAQRKKEKAEGIGQPAMMPGMGGDDQGHGGEPDTPGGERQRLEGATEQEEWQEAFATGFATAATLTEATSAP